MSASRRTQGATSLLRRGLIETEVKSGWGPRQPISILVLSRASGKEMIWIDTGAYC